MQKKMVRLLWLFFYLVVVPSLAFSAATLTDQQNLFIRAEKALAKNQWQTFRELSKQLEDYALYPYLVYQHHMHKLPQLPASSIAKFEEDFPGTPMAKSLREAWLLKQIDRKNWDGFLQGFNESLDTRFHCYAAWARYQKTHDADKLASQLKPLWLVGHSQDQACNQAFATWHAHVGISPTLAWQRLNLALQNTSYTLAYYLVQFFPNNDQRWARQWIEWHKKPALLLTGNSLPNKQHPMATTMLTSLLKRLAYKDPEAAARLWPKLEGQYPFTEMQKSAILHDIALYLTLQSHPTAEKWMNRVSDQERSVTIKEWRVRASIAKGDWISTLRNIKDISEPNQSTECWKYWKARAFAAQGADQQAKTLFKEVAESRSYYGFLASNRLNLPYSIHHERPIADPQKEKEIESMPGVIRAQELLVLGREPDARREWYHATRRLSEDELVAAAQFAERQSWHSWSAYAMNRIKKQNAMPLRFPLAYYQNIITIANRHQVEPAWIFAVTRQESHFRVDARSSVGAMGLMQLLPETGKSMAQQLKIPFRSPNDLLKPNMNLMLGTAYFKELLVRYQNHPVLAIAAYNAGPTRVKQWLPEKTMAADIWVETIPYAETRQYVQHVVENYCIYQNLLGKDPSIKSVTAPILGTSNA